MPDKSITLYALSTCIHCKKTKEYLDDCGAKYDCIFVDKLEGDERNRHEEAKLRRQERRHTDPLGDIEVRLNIKRK